MGGNFEDYNVNRMHPDYFTRDFGEDPKAFFNNVSVVLYSDIFDHSPPTSGNRLTDMSTNSLLANAIDTDPKAHETLTIKYDDVRRQVHFFLEQRNSTLWTIPFEVPQELMFRFSRLLQRLEEELWPDIKRYGSKYHGTSEEIYAFESYLYNAFEKLDSRAMSISKEDKAKIGIISWVKLYLLLFYIMFRGSPSNVVDDINQFLEEYNLDPSEYDTWDTFERIIWLITGQIKPTSANADFLEKANRLEHIFDEFKKLLYTGRIIFEAEMIKAPLFLGDCPAAEVLSILRDGQPWLAIDIDWPDLSSGEKSLLTMYARLYDVFSTDSKDTHIVLIIDEGELYMHPQWQRRFIKDLIDFAAGCFHFQPWKSLDIVLTTNSPFLISDLPHGNIVFLQAIDGGPAVVGGLEEHRQTFAANIHTLLSDAFFLPDGLLGEFAKQKINGLVQELYQDDIAHIREKERSIRKHIEIIGEPVIRNKLISVLEDRLRVQNVSFQQMETRISELEAQIRELKGKG